MTAERQEVVVRFAACQDDEGAMKAWRMLHDDLVAMFPTERLAPVECRIYLGTDAVQIVDGFARADAAQDYTQLRDQVTKLGMRVVVSVDVRLTPVKA